MGKEIKKIYFRDYTTILAFTISLWLVFSYIIFIVSSTASSSAVKVLVAVVGILTVLFATLSLSVVIVHLKRNQVRIYTEEITSLTGENKNE